MKFLTLTGAFFLCFSVTFLGAMDSHDGDGAAAAASSGQQHQDDDDRASATSNDAADVKDKMIAELKGQVADLYQLVYSFDQDVDNSVALQLQPLVQRLGAIDAALNALQSRSNGADNALAEQLAPGSAAASNNEAVNIEALTARVTALQTAVSALQRFSPEQFLALKTLADNAIANCKADDAAVRETEAAHQAYAAQHWAKRGASRVVGFCSNLWANRGYAQVAVILAMRMCNLGLFPVQDTCPDAQYADTTEAIMLADILLQTIRK